MQAAFLPLLRLSFQAPRDAARQVLGLNLGRDALWTALALVAIANTFLMYLGNQPSTTSAVPLPGYFAQPLALFILSAGSMVVFVHAIYWAGKAIGGEGSLMDVLAVVVWFQVVLSIAQVAVILVAIAVPALGALLSVVVLVWGLWLFLNFVAEALQMASPWQALATLIVAFIGLVLGIGILTALVAGFV